MKRFQEFILCEHGEYRIRFEVQDAPGEPWREWIPPFEEDASLPHFIIQWVRYLDDPPRP